MPCRAPMGERLWWLLIGHVFADYVFQPEWMARQKSPYAPPHPSLGPWWWTLLAHGLVNGAMVTAITGSLGLGLGETMAHSGIDVLKCAGLARQPAQAPLWTWLDQLAHLLCKVGWAWLAS